MPVHKQTAKALKKVRSKARTVGAKVLSKVPVKYRPYVKLGARGGNPFLMGLQVGYYAQKYTRPYWGPPVEAIGGRMGEEVRDLYDWLMPQGETEIDPASPWMIPEGYGAPMRPEMAAPRAPTKTKRKISKANRAMKMSYDFYRRKFKGKMTQKKCREIMRKASKMAGKANPHTRSRIGKGGDWIKRHCRKVRKGIWNTTKRTYGR